MLYLDINRLTRNRRHGVPPLILKTSRHADFCPFFVKSGSLFFWKNNEKIFLSNWRDFFSILRYLKCSSCTYTHPLGSIDYKYEVRLQGTYLRKVLIRMENVLTFTGTSKKCYREKIFSQINYKPKIFKKQEVNDIRTNKK